MRRCANETKMEASAQKNHLQVGGVGGKDGQWRQRLSNSGKTHFHPKSVRATFLSARLLTPLNSTQFFSDDDVAKVTGSIHGKFLG